MKKRLALSLALLAGLAMGATSANAADIKAAGSWKIDAGFTGNNYFNGAPNEQKTVSIDQRIRTAFQFIANENLRGVLELQVGAGAWGNGAFAVGQNGGGASNNANANNINIRKAYVDFNWPGTKNRFLVGHQSLSLPSANFGGSAILDHHFSAAAAIVPVTDQIALVGGYARLLDNDVAGPNPTNLNINGTSLDAAFLYADLKFTGFNVQPFAAFAYGGANAAGTWATGAPAAGFGTTAWPGLTAPGAQATEGARAYWVGSAFTMTALDPFKVTADLNYGKATYNANGADKSGRSGWLGDIAVDYTGLSMMTPSLYFAYSSGEDSTRGDSERMPMVAAQNWAIGSFFMQGGDTISNSYNDPSTVLGFWAAGLSLKDIKLIDKLSHTFHLIYFKGTNDENSGLNVAGNYGRVLTEKDSLWEVDLNSKYQVYEELSLGLELGYIFNNYDKATWATAGADDTLSQDAYKATLQVNYSF